MQRVSSSPSKIPYVGFSPVRLQTGIRPQPSSANDGLSAKPTYAHHTQTYMWPKLPSREGDFPRLHSRLFRNRDKAQPDLLPMQMSSNPVQRPLARQRVMLSPRVIAYYGLIRNSQPLPSTYGLYDGSLSYGLVWTGIERLPNLLRASIPSVPPYVPRRTKQLHSTVTSLLILAFATSAQARHPQSHHAGSKVGSVTRLQGSLNATARMDCSPCTGKDFYFRAFIFLSHLRRMSGITMRANSQFPQPDFHWLDTRPYGLRAESAEKRQIVLQKNRGQNGPYCGEALPKSEAEPRRRRRKQRWKLRNKTFCDLNLLCGQCINSTVDDLNRRKLRLFGFSFFI